MIKAIILFVLILCAVSWFARNLYRLIKLVSQGLPENRLKNIPKRIQNVIEQVFLHKRLMNRFGPGLSHLFFFYGFLVIQVCAIEIFLQGFFPHFQYSILGPLYAPIMTMQDIMCFLVIVAIGYATYRRTILQPKHLMLTKDAWTILSLIFGVVSTIYILGATEIALGEREAVKQYMLAEFILSGFLKNVPGSVLQVVKEMAWWSHVLIVLGFLNYLPYSKHLHLLGAIPNIFFAKTERQSALPTPNLEGDNVEVFGASEPAHFTWKHLLDTTACTECGRCTSVCPAQYTGKPLSPMKIVHDLKLALFDTAPKVLALETDPAKQNFLTRADTAMEKLSTDFKKFMSGSPKDDNGAVAAAEPEQLIGGRTSLDELWSCTTCGGCVNACPVLIEHVDDIVDMRRNLVLMQSSFPEELQRTFTALENEGNPWGVSSHSRADWIGDSGVKVLDEGETTPLLYWVGCAGAVDSRARKVTQAMVKILKAANVDFAVLGARETCTGDPARRVGNEYLYQTLAKMNIETLNGNKIQKIVTQCPHCFNTLGKEYPDLGGNYEVVHHSEFIAELIKEGKLKPEARVMENELITFHDPCYLGRWNGVVEEPREVIGALRGTKQIEMERSGKNSFCCGAGGGRMWMEEHIGTPVNKERSREAIETGATTVAVGCPFCNTMITDGVKDLGKGESVKVKDIAELVADSLK